MLTILLVSDDIDISLVQESVVAMSTRMSDLRWDGRDVFSSLVVSRIVLQENMIISCSRLLTVIKSRDIF